VLLGTDSFEDCSTSGLKIAPFGVVDRDWLDRARIAPIRKKRGYVGRSGATSARFALHGEKWLLEDRVHCNARARGEKQWNLLTGLLCVRVALRGRDFDLTAFRVDHPKLAAAVLKTDLAPLAHLLDCV
jgi:hypothetical protein